ncbi:MAG: DUF1858 domain-containing protein [Nanoarchaeota archaeon]
MRKINGNMSILEVVYKYPQTERVFREKGLMCSHCKDIRLDMIKDRLKFHGVDVNEFLKELNKLVK